MVTAMNTQTRKVVKVTADEFQLDNGDTFPQKKRKLEKLAALAGVAVIPVAGQEQAVEVEGALT